LSRELRRKHADDSALVEEVLRMFRDQNFFYTLEPPLLGETPVDEFLFKTRAGFCEHYASAFAVLMRGAGIPARIVTGYHGGDLNQFGNYLIVRQAEAHAWAEVWLEGRGWLRIDPTSAVSPNRVEAGLSAAVPTSETLPMMVRGDLEWLRQCACLGFHGHLEPVGAWLHPGTADLAAVRVRIDNATGD
jgi:transglutaminase-like putative cysteine protease